jgi:hypothetical protein
MAQVQDAELPGVRHRAASEVSIGTPHPRTICELQHLDTAPSSGWFARVVGIT